MQEEISYFDVLKSVITKRKVQDNDIDKHFIPFVTMKWLSKDPKTCHTINILNVARGLQFIPKKDEYIFLKRAVTLPKNKYIAFDKNDKEYNIILLALATHFKCGKQTAKEYMDILGGEKIVALLEKMAQINNKYTSDAKILELRNALQKKKKELLKIKGIR